MKSVFRLVLACVFAWLLWTSYQSIVSVPRDVPVPTTFDLQAMVDYVVAVVFSKSARDLWSLVGIGISVIGLLVLLHRPGEHREAPLNDEEVVAKANFWIKSALPRIQALEARKQDMQKISHELQDISARADALEHEGDGIQALTDKLDTELDELSERIDSVEQERDTGDDYETVVGNLADGQEKLISRVDLLEKQRDVLVTLKTAADAAKLRAEKLADPNEGLIAVLRVINEVLEDVNGDNGILAVLERGDSRYGSALGEQISEIQESIGKITRALHGHDEQSVIVGSFRKQLGRLANGAALNGGGAGH